MAYTIQRKNRVQETLEVKDANGDIALTLSVDINVDHIINEWTKTMQRMSDAEKMKDTDRLGECVVTLFSLIFGAEQTDKLLEFYQNAYSEVLLDVFPFIGDVITPKIAEASADRRKKLLAAANGKHL